MLSSAGTCVQEVPHTKYANLMSKTYESFMVIQDAELKKKNLDLKKRFCNLKLELPKKIIKFLNNLGQLEKVIKQRLYTVMEKKESNRMQADFPAGKK